jgi:hypothetical protein
MTVNFWIRRLLLRTVQRNIAIGRISRIKNESNGMGKWELHRILVGSWIRISAKLVLRD